MWVDYLHTLKLSGLEPDSHEENQFNLMIFIMQQVVVVINALFDTDFASLHITGNTMLHYLTLS